MIDDLQPHNGVPEMPERSAIGPVSVSFDALKALYEGKLATLRALSERSFATTLQALTLNILVVAGLVGGKAELSLQGKIVGSGVLSMFNVAIAVYLIAKSRSHHREKKQVVAIEARLSQLADWPYPQADQTQASFWRSFFGGSFLMVASVIGAGCFATTAVWLTLVQRQPSEDLTVILKSAVPVAASAAKAGP